MADVSTTEIGVFVACAIALIPAVDAIRKWGQGAETRKIEPDPLNVQVQHPPASAQHAHMEYQTEERCNLIHDQFSARLDSFMGELRASLQEHDRKAEARTSEVHERMNKFVLATSEKLNAIAVNTARVEGALDNHVQNHGRTK